MQKECTQLHDRLAKLQTDLEEQIHQNTELLADNGQKQLLIKSKDEEVAAVKAETLRVTKLRDQTMKKLKAMEDSRAETEGQRDVLKTGAILLVLGLAGWRNAKPRPCHNVCPCPVDSASDLTADASSPMQRCLHLRSSLM
jgi:hypothetical protein